MDLFLSLLVIAVLLILACGLALWLVRQQRAVRQPWPATGSSGNASRTPVTGEHARTAPMPLHQEESDSGPETVLSYLDVPPRNAVATTAPVWRPSAPPSDPGPETQPHALAELESADWLRIRPGGRQRIERALQALGDGPVDRAWDTLRGFFPEAAHRQAALETLDRIAMAFEREGRYDVARDVYEHMADIDAEWRQVKLRLMRARGLAQAATMNTWGTVPARPLPDVARKQLGKFLVERQIGKGAMGAVFLGYDPATDRHVALKTMSLAQEFQGDELADARARFLREAEMAGRLQHPDIVSIIDAGEQDGVAFIAMELIEGVDLSQHTQGTRLLPLAQLLPIVARVAEALAYAHSRGVTHRDIKPANIMIDLRAGSVKVMDFGVARVADAARTRTGVVLGTPTFMSPEQLAGQTIDGRSDLYSLGVTLFQLLTGQLPYRNDSMAVLMRAIAHETAPNVCSLRPELPAALGDIVALALEKHPTTRYATGHEMATDLLAVARALQPLDIAL